MIMLLTGKVKQSHDLSIYVILCPKSWMWNHLAVKSDIYLLGELEQWMVQIFCWWGISTFLAQGSGSWLFHLWHCWCSKYRQGLWVKSWF